MWFARKAKQNWKYLQKLQPGLVQGGQGTRISALGSLCTDIEIFQIFLKKYMLFCLMSAYLKQVSPLAPEQARKYLSNHATNIEQLEFLLVLSKLSKNSCERVIRYKYMHKNGKNEKYGS